MAEDRRLHSLHALCRVRKTQEDEAKGAFSALMSQIRDQENKIEGLKENIQREQEASQSSIELHGAFLEWLPVAQENIQKEQTALVHLKQAIPLKKEAMAQAGAARKAVEEVVEKRETQAAYEREQKIQNEMDDLAMRSSYYKRGQDAE